MLEVRCPGKTRTTHASPGTFAIYTSKRVAGDLDWIGKAPDTSMIARIAVEREEELSPETEDLPERLMRGQAQACLALTDKQRLLSHQ